MNRGISRKKHLVVKQTEQTHKQRYTNPRTIETVLRQNAASGGKSMSMFCFQCQETAGNKGCTVRGVCGKTEDVSNRMDLLLYVLRGISDIVVTGSSGRKGTGRAQRRDAHEPVYDHHERKLRRGRRRAADHQDAGAARQPAFPARETITTRRRSASPARRKCSKKRPRSAYAFDGE